MHSGKTLRVLVTGSNKGIGYGILERILQENQGNQSKYHLIMTSRDPKAGEEAAQKLREQYKTNAIEVMKLDVGSKQSVTELVDALSKQGPLDVLINNAGTSFSGPRIDEEVIDVTLGTNYHGAKQLTEAMLNHNLIKEGGKVIFVSSMMGRFGNLKALNPEAYSILSQYNTGTTIEQLDKVVQQYQTEMRDVSQRGKWLSTVYGSSKLYLTIYTYLLSRQKRVLDKHIQVYACCPGWCRTDMTKTAGQQPPKSYLEGADTPYYLMTFKDAIDMSVQGEFFSERTKTNI